VTLYVVLGDGEMPSKEVPHQLEDLWDKAEAEDQNFWFALLAKEHPTATDLELVKFFNANAVHYALIVPADMQAPDLYTDVAEYLDVDTPKTGVDFALSELAEQGEKTVALALFSNLEEDDPADAELIDYIAAALENGREVYALNDSMEPVEIRTEEVAPMPEATVAPKQEDPVESAPEVEDAPDLEPLDKPYLEGLTTAELKELCKGMGIPYTTKAAAVENILAYEAAPATTHPEIERMLDEEQQDEMVLVVIHYPTSMVSKWVPASAVAGL
jgi:hypothetical protein